VAVQVLDPDDAYLSTAGIDIHWDRGSPEPRTANSASDLIAYPDTVTVRAANINAVYGCCVFRPLS
jgi:hypothetical protein